MGCALTLTCACWEDTGTLTFTFTGTLTFTGTAGVAVGVAWTAWTVCTGTLTLLGSTTTGRLWFPF